MREPLRRFGIVAGFGIFAALLLLNALVTRRQVETQVASAKAVSHTQQVLFALEQTESLLDDAETGQRGYLYTGNPRYLAPYRAATAQINGRIDSLASLTADNPVQRQNIVLLRRLSREKLAELAQTIALYRAGNLAEARAIVLSDRGLQAMDSIRTLVESMRSGRDQPDIDRDAAYAHSIRRDPRLYRFGHGRGSFRNLRSRLFHPSRSQAQGPPCPGAAASRRVVPRHPHLHWRRRYRHRRRGQSHVPQSRCRSPHRQCARCLAGQEHQRSFSHH